MSRPPSEGRLCHIGPGPSGPAGGLTAQSLMDLPPADILPEPTVIEVLFLYTPQALAAEGSEEGIRRRVYDALESANFRLTNSLVNVRVDAIHIGPAQYPDSGLIPTDLRRLAHGVEGLEQAPKLRNDYKADVVCLIVENDRNGQWGGAWDITPPKGNPNTGWMVVLRGSLYRDGSNLAHELGHLFGCDHAREHMLNPQNPAFYAARKPYIFGHRFTVEGVTYTDVMSYEPGLLTPYFSNPRLNLDGVPLGVPAGKEKPADGARTINETAPYIARYRNARSRIEFSQATVTVGEPEKSASIRLVRTGDLNTSTRVTVSFDGSSTAKPDLDYTRPVPSIVLFETNQAWAEFVLPIPADGLVEPDETLRLTLVSPLGEHGLGDQSSMVLTIRDTGSPGRIEMEPRRPSVNESAGAAVVRVSVPELPPGFTNVVAYRTEEGTAKSGLDYEPVAGAWLASAMPLELSIPIHNRLEPGPDRSFRLIVGFSTNEIRIVDNQRLGAVLSASGTNLGARFESLIRGDGSLLVWGKFSAIGDADREGIALLKPDGSADESFRPPVLLLGHRRMERIGEGSSSANLNRIAVQPDGKILVGGRFARADGERRGSLVRLEANGRLDRDFGRDLSFDGEILDLAVQPDLRVLAVGDFEKINGEQRSFIARLKGDGTPDESFRPNGGPRHDASTVVFTLGLQRDGRTVIGGRFQRVDGAAALNVARLNENGTHDPTFNLRAGASGQVGRIRIQPDDKILLAGTFETVGGRASARLARLNADGSVDADFRPPAPNGLVFDMTCLPDGRILIGGTFTHVAGRSRRHLALLNEDGSLDASFDPGDILTGPLYGMRANVFADGTLRLSGSFDAFPGEPSAALLQLRFDQVSPKLSRPGFRQDHATLILHGVAGGRYDLEASANLERWESAGDAHLSGFSPNAPVTVSAGLPTGFFRARKGGPVPIIDDRPATR